MRIIRTQDSKNSSSEDILPLELLDGSTQDFYCELDQLDRIPTRTQDTAFVFYVKAAQRSAPAILSNLVLYIISYFSIFHSYPHSTANLSNHLVQLLVIEVSFVSFDYWMFECKTLEIKSNAFGCRL